MTQRRYNSELLKFAITGGLGSITNLAIFYLFVDVLNGPAIPMSIIAYTIAASQNYILNHKYTFGVSNDLSSRAWALYLTGSLAGLAINLLVLHLTLDIFPMAVIAQGCGILAGLLVNFVVAKFLVFRKLSAD